MSKLKENKNIKNLSLDFIAGLITNNGYFGWTTYSKNNQKIPVFQLQMNYENKNILFAVKNTLGLKESIYEYNYKDKNKPLLKRHVVKLLVRKREIIKKIIIPIFNNKLHGLKRKQFNKWKKEFLDQERQWKYKYIQTISNKRMIDNEKL